MFNFLKRIKNRKKDVIPVKHSFTLLLSKSYGVIISLFILVIALAGLYVVGITMSEVFLNPDEIKPEDLTNSQQQIDIKRYESITQTLLEKQKPNLDASVPVLFK